MKKFEHYIKLITSLCILEIVVLTFNIIYGLDNGFKLWNWLIITISVLVYLVFLVIIISIENKRLKRINKDLLIVSAADVEKAQSLLKAFGKYFNDNQKIANDLKIYLPFYKSILKRIAKGTKLNITDNYGFIDQLIVWQKSNYEDAFLMDLYDILKNNIV